MHAHDKAEDRPAHRPGGQPGRIPPRLAATRHEALLWLQRAAGNRAVVQVLRSSGADVQRKLGEDVDQDEVVKDIQNVIKDASPSIIKHALRVIDSAPEAFDRRKATLYAAQWVPRYACAQYVDSVLRAGGINYVVGGSFSTFLNGSQRIADDLDLHVAQRDVGGAVEALLAKGFERDPGQRSVEVNELVPKDQRYWVPKASGLAPFHVQVVNATEMLGPPILASELEDVKARESSGGLPMGLPATGVHAAVAERLFTMRISGRNIESKGDEQVFKDLVVFNKLTIEDAKRVQAAMPGAKDLDQQFIRMFVHFFPDKKRSVEPDLTTV